MSENRERSKRECVCVCSCLVVAVNVLWKVDEGIRVCGLLCLCITLVIVKYIIQHTLELN